MNIKGLTSNTKPYSLNIGKASKKEALVDGLGNFKGLPKEAIQKIQDMAREGAEKGVYMGETYNAFINQFEADYVSPDRAGLASALAPVVQNAKNMEGDGEDHYLSLIDMVTQKIREWSGKNTGLAQNTHTKKIAGSGNHSTADMDGMTGSIRVGAMGSVCMHIYDKHGQNILDYSSNLGASQWVSLPTRAEQQYRTLTTSIYYSAYTEACKDIKERTAAEGTEDSASPRFSIRV